MVRRRADLLLWRVQTGRAGTGGMPVPLLRDVRLLHDQHDDQLSVTDLWAANDKWARLTQFSFGFQ